MATTEGGEQTQTERLGRADALVALGFFVAALIPALRVAQWMHFPEEATDPILNALLILDGGDLTHNHNPRFGYGRALTWLPMVAAADGLMDLAMFRAVAAATMAPMAWFAARLLGLGRVASLSAGALLVLSPPVLENLRWGHEAYMSPEWSALAVVGFALLIGEHRGEAGDLSRWGLTRRTVAGALVLGAAWPMALMNHPFAGCLITLFPCVFLVRRGALWRGGLLAVLTAAIVAMPHAWVVLHAGGIGTLARPFGGEPLGLASAGALLSGLDTESVWLLGVAPAATAFGLRETRWLAVATVCAMIVAVALAATANTLGPWYWKPLVVPCAICIAALARGDRKKGGIVLATVVLVVASGSANALRPEEHWSLSRADVIDRIARALDEDGRAHGLAGYGQSGRREPDTVALTIDALLADALTDRLATTPEAIETSPQVVYLEGDELWVEALMSAFPAASPRIDAGPGGIAVTVPSPDDARQIGTRLCELSHDPVHYDDLADAFPHPLSHGQGFDGYRPPGVADCTVRE